MSRDSSQFNKQNELIRSLRKQLEATEQELANQKWVFEQFMQSPSWRLTFPIRWLPGSAILRSEPVVRELADCAASVRGKEPPIVGFEAPCDMYVFHQAFGIPAVLWGPRGGNTHGPDEYLEVDSVVDAAKTLLLFVCRWCGWS